MEFFDLVRVEGDLLEKSRALICANALFKDVLNHFVLFTLAHTKSIRPPTEKYTKTPLIKGYMGTNRIFRGRYIRRKVLQRLRP